MKNLRLEVGKTYLNRKGQKVKIVNDDNHDNYPFDGDNNRNYTPSGSYYGDDEESPDDLISEVEPPQPKKSTLKIPEGAKEISVTETEGKIVVEFIAPPKFKEGDVVYNNGRIMIVKSLPSSYYFNFWPCVDIFNFNGKYGSPFDSPDTRLATEKEKQQLFDALKKEGYKWNAEKMCVEEITEREKIEEFLKSKRWGVSEGLVNIVVDYIKHREGK